MSGRTAVVLFNLGSPQREEDIEPFLYNFFMDKNIISAALPLRWLAARAISRSRSRGAARDAYAKLDFRSPLLENTQRQADALQAKLREKGMDATCHVSMRYWHPTARAVAAVLDRDPPDTLVMLPLYPQYSGTTTGSSFENFRAVVKADAGALEARWDGQTKVRSICCYPEMDGFIDASVDNIRKEFAKAPAGTRLLMSAHGLPKKVVARGDPYQRQCEQTAAAVAARLQQSGMPDLDWQICYQSRVGPLEWIGPSIDEALQKAARDGRGVVIYPHAFVSEHVETLVELDIEYRHRAQELGISYYARAATAGTHPAFIAGLAGLVTEAASGRAAEGMGRACACCEARKGNKKYA